MWECTHPSIKLPVSAPFRFVGSAAEVRPPAAGAVRGAGVGQCLTACTLTLYREGKQVSVLGTVGWLLQATRHTKSKCVAMRGGMEHMCAHTPTVIVLLFLWCVGCTQGGLAADRTPWTRCVWGTSGHRGAQRRWRPVPVRCTSAPAAGTPNSAHTAANKRAQRSWKPSARKWACLRRKRHR